MEPLVSGVIAATAQPVGPQDRVTAYGWKALAGSVVGYSMDGFDMLILGFMLAAIKADLVLTSAQAGSLVTWTLVGAVAGGLIFGLCTTICRKVHSRLLSGKRRIRS